MANPYFNATYYLATNSDLAAAGITTEEGAWNHYVEYGASEERAPAPWFDIAYYLEQNPDLAEAGLTGADLFAHFGTYGVLEGRQPSAQSAAEVTEEALAVYAAANADLREAFGIEGSEITEEQYAQLANHFYLYGYNEDRPGAPVEYDLPEPVDPEEPSIPGETYTLTEGRDTVIGTENDDTVLGFVGQNQNGTLTNALSTGDYIDGGAGRDKIVATVMEDQEGDSGADAVINARTVNVEEVHLEALDLNGGRAANDLVVVDAGRMDSVEEFWSDNSSADLEILDVRLGSKLSITKDITFGLRETDFATNFGAYFDSQSLVRAGASTLNSQLLIRIADVSTETPATPLANVNLNLSFDLGTETVNLVGVRSTDGTYAGLVAALRTALEEAGYADVNVDLSTPYEQVTFAGNTVTLPFVAQEILLTDPSGNEFSNVNFTQSAIEPVAGGFLVAGNAAPVEPDQVSNLIESNLVLDNAGRGSTAGDVVIGGMSNSQKGVEKFNVTVDRDSKIASLNTTFNKLQQIEIDSQGANGSLVIGATQAGLTEIDANAFAGENLGLGTLQDVVNLRFLDAGDTAANVTFNGFNFAGKAFVVNTGSGNDTITVEQYGGSSTSVDSQTDSVINAGDGDNKVEVIGENTSVIITGSGSDVIRGNNVAITASTGGGNDVIYVDNTGDWTRTILEANSDFAAGTGVTVGPDAHDILFTELLYGREVQVTLGLPGMNPADSFFEGLEATATIQAANGGYLTTERDLYEAAARAINEHPVLSQLATARVDSNGHLYVDYKIDGETVAADELVQIEVLGDWGDLSASQQTNIVNALKTKYKDSTIDAGDIETAYDDAALIEDFAEVSGLAIPGQEAIFTVDLATLTAGATSGDTLTFSVTGFADGILTEGADFTGQATGADLAVELDGSTVTVDGVTYDISLDAGSVIRLTAQTPEDVGGVLSVTDAVPTTVGGTEEQAGIDPSVDGIGSNSGVSNLNVINAGTGNDIIVLNSADNVADTGFDTIEFDVGGFGDDTVVHFTAGVDGDVLDFSDWLNNEFYWTTSTSTESRDRVDTAINGDANISAHEITIINFEDLGLASTVSFGNVTNAQVEGVLEANYGVQQTADLVGNAQNSLLLVQHFDARPDGTTNEGVYKVYQVSSNNTTAAVGDADFSVTLVGSLDFGAEQAFTADNFF